MDCYESIKHIAMSPRLKSNQNPPNYKEILERIIRFFFNPQALSSSVSPCEENETKESPKDRIAQKKPSQSISEMWSKDLRIGDLDHHACLDVSLQAQRLRLSLMNDTTREGPGSVPIHSRSVSQSTSVNHWNGLNIQGYFQYNSMIDHKYLGGMNCKASSSFLRLFQMEMPHESASPETIQRLSYPCTAYPLTSVNPSQSMYQILAQYVFPSYQMVFQSLVHIDPNSLMPSKQSPNQSQLQRWFLRQVVHRYELLTSCNYPALDSHWQSVHDELNEFIHRVNNPS